MMDIKKIVALLEKKRDEAIYVASLPPNNNEFIPWRRNLEDILETAFGVESTEYKRVHDAEVRWQGKAHWDKYGYKELVHNIHLEISSIIQKYEVLEIPFDIRATSDQAEVRTDVRKGSNTLLDDIFSASLESPDGINALKFRADNEQSISELNELETSGFIERRGDRYFIRPLTLAQLAQQNPKAQEMIRTCSLVFDFLRGAYKDSPRQKSTVSDISKGTSLPERNIRSALQIIIQTPILGAHSNDLAAEDAFIEPSESILKYKSFEGILQEMQEQAKDIKSRYRKSKETRHISPEYLEEMRISLYTSQKTWDAIKNEYDVTKRSFGKKINFVSGSHKRNIIFRDVEHAFLLESAGFLKPAVILAGSVIEELLRLYLKHKNIKPINADFEGYIKTCEQEKLLESGISRLSDSERHFRNLVHLSKEKTKKQTISKSKAKGAVASIFTIADDF